MSNAKQGAATVLLVDDESELVGLYAAFFEPVYMMV